MEEHGNGNNIIDHKTIIINTPLAMIPQVKKSEKKRIITRTKKWNFTADELQNQYDIIVQLCATGTIPVTPSEKVIVQQINQKLSSYKYQDQLKGIYDPDNFVHSVHYIVSLLAECKLLCFYCKNMVAVIYEKVCDPAQWTIERIDNNVGHNYDNICIACLKCNLGRRTMHQNRYLFTKKCTTVVLLEDHYETPTF